MKIILIFILINSCLSILKILELAHSNFHNNQIQYGIANFGDIPYGKSITGLLEQYPIQDLCTIDKNLNGSNAFVLAHSGRCTFVHKSVNAQKIGAKVLIIIDNITIHQKVIMSDDGSGRQVHIPTLFISEADGLQLQKQLQNNQKIKLMVKFTVNKTQKAEVKFWLASNTRETYILIRQFREYYQKLKDYIKLDLAYFTFQCRGCSNLDCLPNNNNTYCLVDMNHHQTQVGRLIIQQQFREYAIFRQDINLWFLYMDQFDNIFTQWGNAEQISRLSMQKVKLNENQVKLIRYSFNETELLKKWRNEISKSSILEVPDVSINGINYQGNVNAADIAEMVCASLKDLPNSCSEFFELTTSDMKPKKTGWVILGYVIVSIFIVVAAGFLIFIIYRRLVKKQITNEMSSKVTEQVANYISLIEQQQKKNKQREIEKIQEDL